MAIKIYTKTGTVNIEPPPPVKHNKSPIKRALKYSINSIIIGVIFFKFMKNIFVLIRIVKNTLTKNYYSFCSVKYKIY